MAHFPVTNSTLSAAHIGRFLGETYLLGATIRCRLLKTGINDTYLVETESGNYVFRVYSFNWRKKEGIHEELDLLNLLKGNQIPVSWPVADAAHTYIQHLPAPEGERYAVLFTFAPGEKQPALTAEAHYRIGELMARFHAITKDRQLKRVTYTPAVLLSDSLDQISAFLDSGSAEMRFMRTAADYLATELGKADHSQLRNGIVHLDIWYDNLNITSTNQVTVFDFDFCGNGWLCLDLAYYILQLHNTEKYEAAAYEPKLEQFLKGYESITAISAEEKRLIPILGVSLYFFYLGVQCQRYDNWSNTFLNEGYLKRFINGLVKRYYDLYLSVGNTTPVN